MYILQSIKTGKFYTGHSNDLPHRLIQHNSGYSKSTKPGIPWVLVYTEEFTTRAGAMGREQEIKSMKSRDYIMKLIDSSK